MKQIKQSLLIFFAFLYLSCHSNNNNPLSGSESKTDTTSLEIKPESSAVETADKGPEVTDVPVYAVWSSKKNNSMLDGMYDSTSGYFKLCQNDQLFHIDDPSEVSINAGEDCYNQGTAFNMVIIRHAAGKPLFLKVLTIDAANKRVVALTDNNDTITTSAGTMNDQTFEKLKMQYQPLNYSHADQVKIEKYLSPEMEDQNQKKKEMVMKKNEQYRMHQ